MKSGRQKQKSGKQKKQADQRIEQMKAMELSWDIGVGIAVLIFTVMNIEKNLIWLALLICVIRILVRENYNYLICRNKNMKL